MNLVLRVKLQQNVRHLWIIVPSANEHLAWSGTRWTPIYREGIGMGNEMVSSFATPVDAVKYAESVGFEVEHG